MHWDTRTFFSGRTSAEDGDEGRGKRVEIIDMYSAVLFVLQLPVTFRPSTGGQNKQLPKPAQHSWTVSDDKVPLLILAVVAFIHPRCSKMY